MVIIFSNQSFFLILILFIISKVEVEIAKSLWMFIFNQEIKLLNLNTLIAIRISLIYVVNPIYVALI